MRRYLDSSGVLMSVGLFAGQSRDSDRKTMPRPIT
jgi:hypothetical protein